MGHGGLPRSWSTIATGTRDCNQTVWIALAASTPGGPLVETLATEIDAVRTSRHSYGYRESNILAQELDRIREGITEYLLPAQPRAAAELL